MSTHKYIDRICIAAISAAFLLTVLFANAQALGVASAVKIMGYETRLFDTSRVHTIDIVTDDWDGFIATAQSEEYSECSVVIDGESFKSVGIRGKGNTSLSTVASMNSERYSFKLEFDHYDSNKSYHGLDKLSLNNIIQDNTYTKDYLTYRMMNEFGVSAPLCSYAYITVNGEDWGLYLAVEGVEEAFLKRNYGSGYGELYKPDSLSFGGGRGNGMDFDFSDFANRFETQRSAENSEAKETDGGFADLTPPDISGEMPDLDFSDFEKTPDMGGFGGFGGFGMGSSDVKLKYSDDNYDSYSNIFDNAKTDITDSDKDRLIASLKDLSEYNNIEAVVDIDAVLRYFTVHNFVCNGDSYTGSMIHNYYLYEKDGQLSMIPWDYNLAFGTFQASDATEQVNSPIDTPVSGDVDDRPMVGWIFSDEKYTEMYHEYFAQFLAEVDITGIIDSAYELISDYVEKDPTKFCTYEEFEKGVSTLKTFCELRTESILGQLDGSVPSTSEGQSADSSALIDASSISLSDMGTMNTGGGSKGSFGGRGQRGEAGSESESSAESPTHSVSAKLSANNDSGFGGMAPPDGFDGQAPNFENSQMPADENGNPVMPEGFDGSSFDFGNFTPPSEGSPSESTSEEAERSETEQSEAERSETEQSEAEQSEAEQAGDNTRNPFGGGENRDFGNMQPMQGGESGQTDAMPYILFGASILSLAGGLIFAFKFKR